MARSGIFPGLRRRQRGLGTILAYALLLNALFAAVFNVQAIAAAIDPLSVAATCDSTGTRGDPVQHNNRHQPDCTLCGPACPMAGSAQGVVDGVPAAPAAPSATMGLDATTHRATTVNPPSIHISDAKAQAPPRRA